MQPNCRKINSRLGLYLDGELSPIERRLVEDHVRQCNLCRTELKEIREISGAFVETVTAPPLPSGLTQRIMDKARVQAESASPGWNSLRFWRNWSFSMRFAAAGVAVAACYIGLVIGSASLQSIRQPGDEAQWIGDSRGPLVAAFTGSNR